MKVQLTTSGKVELSEDEILDALRTYCVRYKYVKPAIDLYLKERNNLTTKRIQFDETLTTLVAEVEGTFVQDNRNVFKNETPRTVRRNTGINQTLREYLEGEKKKNNEKETCIPYEAVWAMLKKKYPTLTERQFDIYIRDKRQIKNINIDSKTKTIIIK